MEVSFRLWSLKFQQKTRCMDPWLESALHSQVHCRWSHCPLSCVFAGNGTLTKQTPLIGASRAYLCRELYIPISPSAKESQKFLIVIWLLDCIPWSGWRHWLHSYRIKTIAIELPRLALHSIVVLQLVWPVHSTHVLVVSYYIWRTWNHLGTAITLFPLYGGATLWIAVCGHDIHQLAVSPHASHQVSSLARQALSSLQIAYTMTGMYL